MYIKRAFLTSIIILLYTSITHAQPLTSPGYTLVSPRIVVSGGSARSDNYTLNFASIGNTLGGIAGSLNYSLNTNPASMDRLSQDSASDTTPPAIVRLEPGDGTLKELNNHFTVTCFAEDDSALLYPLYYRFSINGNLSQDWISESAYNWNTQGLSCGIYPVTVEVKDIGGNQTSETAEMFLIHKPPRLPQ